jgi:hypothetical protein
MHRLPPLWVWLISALLIASALLALHWTGERYRHERTQAFVQSQQQRLDDYLSRNPGPRIVMIGDSLMRAAMPYDALPTTPALPWLRIYHATDDFAPFIPFWPSLLTTPPDTLIIHADLLLPRPSRDKQKESTSTLLDDLHDWRDLQKTWRFDDAFRQHQYMKDARRAQSKTACLKSHPSWKKTRKKMMQRRHRYHHDTPIAEEQEHYLRQAAAHIPNIILLDIPRSQSIEEHFGEDTRHWLQVLGHHLSDLPNVRITTLGEPLADACYCDYRHLKPACRSQLSGALRTLAEAAAP